MFCIICISSKWPRKYSNSQCFSWTLHYSSILPEYWGSLNYFLNKVSDISVCIGKVPEIIHSFFHVLPPCLSQFHPLTIICTWVYLSQEVIWSSPMEVAQRIECLTLCLMSGAWNALQKRLTIFHMKGKNEFVHFPITRHDIQDIYWICWSSFLSETILGDFVYPITHVLLSRSCSTSQQPWPWVHVCWLGTCVHDV